MASRGKINIGIGTGLGRKSNTQLVTMYRENWFYQKQKYTFENDIWWEPSRNMQFQCQAHDILTLTATEWWFFWVRMGRMLGRLSWQGLYTERVWGGLTVALGGHREDAETPREY